MGSFRAGRGDRKSACGIQACLGSRLRRDEATGGNGRRRSWCRVRVIVIFLDAEADEQQRQQADKDPGCLAARAAALRSSPTVVAGAIEMGAAGVRAW